MNDAGAMIKTALLAQTPLTAIIGTRLWPERTMPIAGYTPNTGVAIAFRTRGGGTMYHSGLMFPSVQFKIWGIDEFTANTGYRTLVDVLDGKSPGAIKIANLEGLGQTAQEQDPSAAWVFVLCFFTIWLAR